MSEAPLERVSCRLCDTPVTRDAMICPSCGVKAPWIPDEPAVDPRLIRVAMWGGGIVLFILLLFTSGMLIFGPAAEDAERSHTPPRADAPAHEAR